MTGAAAVHTGLEPSVERRGGWRQLPRRFLLAVLIWTPVEIAAFNASALSRGSTLTWDSAAPGALSVLLMAGLALLVWWAVERWPPVGSRRRPAHYLVHLALFAAVTALYVIGMEIPGWRQGEESAADIYVWNLGQMALGYVFDAAIGASFLLRDRLMDEESRSARLAAQLTQSQLSVLRAQLHPHFFFNTLNAIAELVHKDRDAASHTVARLGAFLRYSLEVSEVQAVPLREEVDALQAYLDIIRLRFGDRVTVETRLEPAALAVPVPPLLLQPLVENALKHGLEPKEGAGRLEITAGIADGVLRLEVRDDGLGLRPSAAGRRSGIGLRNTRERLQQTYGAAASLTVEARPGGGVVASITLPAGQPKPRKRIPQLLSS